MTQDNTDTLQSDVVSQQENVEQATSVEETKQESVEIANPQVEATIDDTQQVSNVVSEQNDIVNDQPIKVDDQTSVPQVDQPQEETSLAVEHVAEAKTEPVQESASEAIESAPHTSQETFVDASQSVVAEQPQEQQQVQEETITTNPPTDSTTQEPIKVEAPQYTNDEFTHFGVKLRVQTKVPAVDLTKQTIDVGGGVRRKATEAEGLVFRNNPKVTTCYESVQNAIKLHKDNKALGYRPIVNNVAGNYVWMTYAAFAERMNNFSSGLIHLGVQPRQHMGIYAKNRPEWQVASEGAFCQSLVTISLYDTLGEESSKYILNHGEIVVVCCSSETLPRVLKLAPECPMLKIVISFDPVTDDDKNSAQSSNIKLHTLAEVESLGKEHPTAHNPPVADDLMSIMYTSGTTGTPKGVMLTHKNMVSVATGVQANIEAGAAKPLNSKDVLISYLPLAHILQRAAEMVFMSIGASIGYYQGNVFKLAEDFQALKPTVLTAVPRVLDRLYDRLTSTVNSASNFRKNLFNKALTAKKKAKGKKTLLWDALVFKKVRATIGGNVRAILSGGAPLRAEVHETLMCALCCPIIQGYGLTETCAAGTLQIPGDYSFSNVGCPLSCMEIKLQSVPDMKYFADAEVPKGEVLLRGPAVSRGYFKDPQKTAEDFDADGFFHTGDIGQWNPNGTLSIIDRKKALFKLSQGEYISPEALEAKFCLSPYLSRCWVYGDSLKSVLVAVGVVDKPQLLNLAQEHKIENATEEKLPELLTNADLKQAILKTLDQIADTEKLQGFERVKAIHLVSDDFDVIDCVTPTQKLQRNKLQIYFQKEINEMYDALANSAK